MKHLLSRLALIPFVVLGTPSGAQDIGETLQKIKDTKTITLGAREATVPFSYLDENQKSIGYSMDLCVRIADRVKARLNLDMLDVRYNFVTTATRIPLLTNGTIDLSCDAATNTVERQKQVAFAVTHYVAAGRIMMKKGAGFRSLDDLRGKSVVSTAGSTNLKQLIELNREKQLGMSVISAKDHGEAFLMLQTGRAVAFIMDDVLAAGVAASARDPEAYLFADEILSMEPYGIIIRRDDPVFQKLVDDTLTEIYKSGEIKTIYSKWFENPIPPKGVNLRLPMSEALKKVVGRPTASADPADYRP